MQDGATPAVLASKAGHREIADLIAAGGSAAARHHLPTQAPPRVCGNYIEASVQPDTVIVSSQ